MLGGYERLSNLDASGSLAFVDEFVNGKKSANGVMMKEPVISKALACGTILYGAYASSDPFL